jgi:hypothetical protein
LVPASTGREGDLCPDDRVPERGVHGGEREAERESEHEREVAGERDWSEREAREGTQMSSTPAAS